MRSFKDVHCVPCYVVPRVVCCPVLCASRCCVVSRFMNLSRAASHRVALSYRVPCDLGSRVDVVSRVILFSVLCGFPYYVVSRAMLCPVLCGIPC